MEKRNVCTALHEVYIRRVFEQLSRGVSLHQGLHGIDGGAMVGVDRPSARGFVRMRRDVWRLRAAFFVVDRCDFVGAV